MHTLKSSTDMHLNNCKWGQTTLQSEGTLSQGVTIGFQRKRVLQEGFRNICGLRESESIPGWGRKCSGNEPVAPAEGHRHVKRAGPEGEQWEMRLIATVLPSPSFAPQHIPCPCPTPQACLCSNSGTPSPLFSCFFFLYFYLLFFYLLFTCCPES